MKLSKMFPSRWLAGADLEGKTPTVTIRAITKERVGAPPQDEEKYVMWFEGKEKGLILNKTNGVSVGQMYGDETDNWMGKPIQLYTQRVKAFGAVHNAIRIRSAGTVSAAPMPPVDAEPEDVLMDDDEDPVPESLADAPEDTAAHLATPPASKPKPTKATNGNGELPLFKNVQQAREYGVESGAYSDLAAASDAYAELKAKINPGSAGEMWAAWIEHCKTATA